MQSDKALQKKIQIYLNVPETREQIRQYLQQEPLTTSINQAAKIVGADQTKLRSWEEKIGLFSAERASTDNKFTQRRYDMQDIARLLVFKTLLDQQYPLKDVTAFMQENTSFIDDLVNDIVPSRVYQERIWKAVERLNWAEEAAFWRMFVPRLLYLSMRLLFTQTPDNDTWLLLPLQWSNSQTAEDRVESREQLPMLGEVLLGHCSNEHPFFMCITRKPLLDDLPKQYKVKPLEWPLASSDSPVRVHAVLEERRRRRSSESILRAAGRLLQLLQKTQAQWKLHLQDSNDAMTYYAPEFEKALPGDQILNKIADQIIYLGGVGEVSQQPRWHFCCILLPPDEDVFRQPRKQHRLIVQGQSRESPHDLNKKTVLPYENSISMKAYHSRHIIYRPDIVAEEPDIAAHDQEEGIRSAIAVPIEGKEAGGWRTLHPLGVLYVTSREVDAFSKDDDLLLLRVMEKIVAEQVMAYLMRTLLVDKFAEMIDHPRIVDSNFKEFPTDNQFISQLEAWLKQIQFGQNINSPSESESQPFHDLAFIAVDLSIPNHKTGARATERATKSLTGAIGKSIKQWARGKYGFAEVYYMHDDCYYLLLRDISLKQTAVDAFNLLNRLRRYIQHHSQQYGLPKGISLHLGVIGYTYDMLQDLQAELPPGASLRVKMTQLLDDALDMSKEAGENKIAIWQPQDEKFDYYDELTKDRSSLLQDDQFIEQVANLVRSKLQEED